MMHQSTALTFAVYREVAALQHDPAVIVDRIEERIGGPLARADRDGVESVLATIADALCPTVSDWQADESRRVLAERGREALEVER